MIICSINIIVSIIISIDIIDNISIIIIIIMIISCVLSVCLRIAVPSSRLPDGCSWILTWWFRIQRSFEAHSLEAPLIFRKFIPHDYTLALSRIPTIVDLHVVKSVRLVVGDRQAQRVSALCTGNLRRVNPQGTDNHQDMYLSLSLSIYIYIYIYMFRYIYIYICIYVYMFMSVYVYVYIYICIYVYIHLYHLGSERAQRRRPGLHGREQPFLRLRVSAHDYHYYGYFHYYYYYYW